MKTRQGFVSNSSTTSFCIYGTDQLSRWDEDEKGNTIDLIEQYLVGTGNEAGLEWHSPEGSNTYIGVSWAGVRDDETGAQFKARAEVALNALMDRAGYTGERRFTTHSGEYWS